MAAAPKAAPTPAQIAAAGQLTEHEKSRTDKICQSAFLMAVSIAICVPARAPLVLGLKKGNAAETAKTMGMMSTTAAAIEFLLNPVLGRLSDKYGRKPFLIMATSVNAFLHSLVALFPGNLTINIVDRSISGAMIFCFMNPIGAALQDLFVPHSMAKIGVVGAKLGSYFGLGFALGPLIGSKLGGGKAFAASALGFAATAASVNATFEETLPLEKRKEFDIKAANPFNFLRLFGNQVMSDLMATIGFGSFAEYANIYDINFLFLKTVLGYGQNEVGLFATGFGCTQIAGGIIGKELIPKFGQSTYTAIGNAAYMAGFAFIASCKSKAQLVLGLLCLMFGHGRSAYPGTLLVNQATQLGMGRGEIGAAQGNFLAILKIIAPVFYGRVFAWGTSNGRNIPGLPYFIICAFLAAAQASFQKALADGAEKA